MLWYKKIKNFQYFIMIMEKNVIGILCEIILKLAVKTMIKFYIRVSHLKKKEKHSTLT